MSNTNKKPSNPRMNNPDGIHAAEARKEDCYTLRDHFAGLAMQSALEGLYKKEKFVSSDELLDSLSLIPKNAYWVADRMLEQREK